MIQALLILVLSEHRSEKIPLFREIAATLAAMTSGIPINN